MRGRSVCAQYSRCHRADPPIPDFACEIADNANDIRVRYIEDLWIESIRRTLGRVTAHARLRLATRANWPLAGSDLLLPSDPVRASPPANG